MKTKFCSLRSACLSLVVSTTMLPIASAGADIVIEFTGMNLVYDGSSLFDAGSVSGGFADPGDADALASVDFFQDGILAGHLGSNIFLDIFIPDLNNIPNSPGSTTVLTTPGNPGFFDLLIGTSPLASEFLILDLNSVTLSLTDIGGQMQFIFGAAVANQFAENLPFGLAFGDTISVSFSAQIDPGSLTSNGEQLTGFTVSGTGEYRGPVVPAPASAILVPIGAMIIAPVRRRSTR